MRSWFQLGAYGLALAASIALLEFAYYHPLLSASGKPGLALLASLLLVWCGEGVLLAWTVRLFEAREAPRPLGAARLFLAVAIGSIGGVLVWQTFVHQVLRARLGVRVLRDYVGQPVSFAGVALYHVWLMLSFGGLAAVLYLSRRRHARVVAMLRAAEVAREISQRQLAETRLAALQARIDPEFVLQSLTRLERSYAGDPAAADRLLEELIEFLRGSREGR
jgi:hypothetical protein